MGLKERVGFLGGDSTFSSKLGSGIAVNISIPRKVRLLKDETAGQTYSDFSDLIRNKI